MLVVVYCVSSELAKDQAKKIDGNTTDKRYAALNEIC